MGGKFAAAGIASQVRTISSLASGDLRHATRALVVDTETRHCPPTEATERVHRLAREAFRENYSYIYKKTDSTLRGNIGAELAGLIEAFDGAPLLYVPAYPQMGRVVKNGSLYVHGIPVSATRFSHDPFNPVGESHIPTVLGAQCGHPIRSVSVMGLAPFDRDTVTICDGESDDDVEAAARAFTSHPGLILSAGSAGFAAHLARHLDLPRTQPPSLPRFTTALIVNGSLHPASHEQIETAMPRGFPSFDSGGTPTPSPSKGWIILEQAAGTGEATLDFARDLAKSVVRYLTEFPFDALIIFGGDTAYAIVDALGNPPLHVLGEAMEGIPVCRLEAERVTSLSGHRDQDLYLVTKAGSFGAPDLLSTLRELLG